jgi:hypothetical protein
MPLADDRRVAFGSGNFTAVNDIVYVVSEGRDVVSDLLCFGEPALRGRTVADVRLDHCAHQCNRKPDPR